MIKIACHSSVKPNTYDTLVIAGISVYRVMHSIVGGDETDSLVIDLSLGSNHCGATKIYVYTFNDPAHVFCCFAIQYY